MDPRDRTSGQGTITLKLLVKAAPGTAVSVEEIKERVQTRFSDSRTVQLTGPRITSVIPGPDAQGGALTYVTAAVDLDRWNGSGALDEQMTMAEVAAYLGDTLEIAPHTDGLEVSYEGVQLL